MEAWQPVELVRQTMQHHIACRECRQVTKLRSKHLRDLEPLRYEKRLQL